MTKLISVVSRNQIIDEKYTVQFFQPFFKIALERALWNLVDVLAGTSLLISVFKKKPLND